MRPAQRIVVLSAIALSTEAAHPRASAAEGPATHPVETIAASDQAGVPVTIPVAAGQSYFVAYGSDASRLVSPCLGGRFVENGRLTLTFIGGQPADGDAKYWRMRLSHALSSGRSHSAITAAGSEFTFKDGLHSDASKVESVDLRVAVEDVSKSTGLSGVALYRIPYARIGEATRFVVIAVAEKPSLFGDLFSLSTAARIDWADLPEVK